MKCLPRMGRTGMILAAALLFLGAPLRARAEGAERIKITVPATAVTFAPLYHAKSAGYFADEGLDVEIVTAEGARSLHALIARDVEFTVAPGTYQLTAYEQGQRVLATMSILTRNSINVVLHRDAVREKGITDRTPLADKVRALKGLRLSGVSVGSFSYQVLLYYLLKAGIDPQKDVSLIGIGAGPALLAALEQRQVDGFATGTPIPEAAVFRGFGVLIVDNAAGEDPDFAEFMMNVLLVHPDYAKQHPEVVRKAVRALLRANAWLLDHSAEESVPFMKPFLGSLDEKILLAGLQKVRLGIPRDGKISERAVTSTQEFLRKIGHLKTRIPYEALVTNEFFSR